MSFIVYPAIDLRGGRVVRLKQGVAEQQVVYSDDPGEVARRWQDQGAEWLHVVDLDRALDETSNPNTTAIARIIASVNIPIQSGGGLRDMSLVKRALDLGISRVLLGTVAVEQPHIVAQAVEHFGAARIAVAIDARQGRVATHGWMNTSGLDAVEFGKAMRAVGVERAVITDIARDGMLSGIDAGAMAAFARATGLRVIASGGVATLDDLRALRKLSDMGIEGAIVGQALYAGQFTLREALELQITN